MAHDGTQLLPRVQNGEGDAIRDLTPLVYDQLRDLAGKYINSLANGALVLQRTALVHEAYVKLAGAGAPDWRTQTHFCAIAALAMQQMLLDHLRHHHRQKRGSGWKRVTLAGLPDERSVVQDLDIEALDNALTKLGRLHERAAKVVQMRFFGGMTEPAIAQVLGVTDRTIRNDWMMARAWLRNELDEGWGDQDE
jgi:RNA polymerase sigma factor (TIGR02999 family)